MSEQTLPNYGGQAVIEGVMMRGASHAAIAMRAPTGQIELHTETLGAIYQSRMARIPFLRGLVVLWDALALGMRALTISANLQAGEDEKLEGKELVLTLAFSILLTIGLFFVLPAGIAHLIDLGVAWLAPVQNEAAATPHWITSVVEGLLRLGILVGYIVLIGRIPDIQRVFGYHGAEHKTINAFEAGTPLTPEAVSHHSLEHPRCGTAFLLSLVLISILIFTLIGPLPLLWRIVSRVLLIPVLASLAYEYIRWTAKNLHNPIVRWLVKPNLALQRLTTREPSLDMIEIAIAAFTAMREKEVSPRA